MKNLIFSCLILLQLLGCTPNPNFDKLEIIFSPALSKPSTFRIDLESQVLELEKLDIRYTYAENLPDYPSEIIARDTVEIIYQKSFKIPTESLHEFVRVIQSIDLDTTIYHGEDALDGYAFYFSKIKTAVDTVSLGAWNFHRTPVYNKEYVLLDGFFELAYATVTENKGISLLESMNRVFSEELLIRKVAKAPLEFRIGEGIHLCRDDGKEFMAFLQTLPENEPIIFDMRNGHFLDCDLNRLKEILEMPKVYFYGNTGLMDFNRYSYEPPAYINNGYSFYAPPIIVNLTYDFLLTVTRNRIFETKEQLLWVLKFKNLI